MPQQSSTEQSRLFPPAHSQKLSRATQHPTSGRLDPSLPDVTTPLSDWDPKSPCVSVNRPPKGNRHEAGLPGLNPETVCPFTLQTTSGITGQQHKGLVMALDAGNSSQTGCPVLVVHAPCLFVVMNNVPDNTYILHISQRRAGEVGCDSELGKAVQGSPRLRD